MFFKQMRAGSVIHTFFTQVRPSAGLYVRSISHGIAQPGYISPTMVRGEYVLHMVLGGQALHNGQPVSAGDAFLMRPMLAHRLEILPDKPFEQYWVEFGGSEASGLIADYTFANTDRFSGIDPSPLLPLLHAAVYDEQDEASASLRQTGLLYMLLALLPQTRAADKSPAGYVRQAMDFLRLNLSEGVTVSDAARAVRLSERYLCRLFLRETGITPIHYLNACRVEAAK